MPETSHKTDFDFERRLGQRLQEILDAMPIAVTWATLKDQKLQFINRKFNQMFGYILGDHATISEWIENAYPNPEHVTRANEMWLPYLTSTSIRPIEIPQVEVDVLCKNGEVKTTLLGGVILPQEGWGLATFVDITDRKENEVRIEKLAMEDPLTGLANRRAFDEILKGNLSRAKRGGKKTALLLVDLDDLKTLNDTLGHDVGDLILQVVAERLRSSVRSGDVVCRLGGDEFSIVADAVDGPGTVEEMAVRIIQEIRKPLTLEDTPIDLSVSIGIGIYPEDAEDTQELYKHTDEALYRAKHAGRGRWNR